MDFPPIIAGQKACLNVNCGYVHLEQEIDEGEPLEREKMSDLPKIWLIYMLIDETIYVKKLDGVGPVDNRPSTD